MTIKQSNVLIVVKTTRPIDRRLIL